ncbi:MAG: sn-glycerol-3-phosphate ABC transporter ATP-binding protein UgpC [Clostridia bacterium]|nr:sn-glycerol-3-phosphate ABC transporter ATP-binding protein UgpC [Clostridia bacterium]
MASLSLVNLKKVYDNKVVAVDDFNLEIEDKEFIVFVGPSGCGKSTTLRMIAGLEEISSGELYIDDRLVNSVAPKDRDIAMVFQNYALYPHMTVYENMAFALKLRKTPKKEIDVKVREAAEILGITDLLDRKPKALSGGQRQRVAIGRAIVREPKVFLMDEPLSNLDAKLRNQMRAEIIKLRHRIDTTFIYVTHDQTEAMTLGDRIVIMKDGIIQQIGTPQQVFNHPANLFVAGFIGTPQMNFFEAELDKKADGGYVVRAAGAEFELSAEQNAVLSEKEAARLENAISYDEDGLQVSDSPNEETWPKNVTLGIRPEHISLCTENDDPRLEGKVDVCEMMGSSMHLHVDIGDKDVVLVLQTVDLPMEKRAGFAYGEQVCFSFDAALVHLFDAETEENLI